MSKKIPIKLKKGRPVTSRLISQVSKPETRRYRYGDETYVYDPEHAHPFERIQQGLLNLPRNLYLGLVGTDRYPKTRELNQEILESVSELPVLPTKIASKILDKVDFKAIAKKIPKLKRSAEDALHSAAYYLGHQGLPQINKGYKIVERAVDELERNGHSFGEDVADARHIPIVGEPKLIYEPNLEVDPYVFDRLPEVLGAGPIVPVLKTYPAIGKFYNAYGKELDKLNPNQKTLNLLKKALQRQTGYAKFKTQLKNRIIGDANIGYIIPELVRNAEIEGINVTPDQAYQKLYEYLKDIDVLDYNIFEIIKYWRIENTPQWSILTANAQDILEPVLENIHQGVPLGEYLNQVEDQQIFNRLRGLRN